MGIRECRRLSAPSAKGRVRLCLLRAWDQDLFSKLNKFARSVRDRVSGFIPRTGAKLVRGKRYVFHEYRVFRQSHDGKIQLNFKILTETFSMVELKLSSQVLRVKLAS